MSLFPMCGGYLVIKVWRTKVCSLRCFDTSACPTCNHKLQAIVNQVRSEGPFTIRAGRHDRYVLQCCGSSRGRRSCVNCWYTEILDQRFRTSKVTIRQIYAIANKQDIVHAPN